MEGRKTSKRVQMPNLASGNLLNNYLFVEPESLCVGGHTGETDECYDHTGSRLGSSKLKHSLAVGLGCGGCLARCGLLRVLGPL